MLRRDKQIRYQNDEIVDPEACAIQSDGLFLLDQLHSDW